LTTFQLEIWPDLVVVRIPEKNFATTIPNEITVRDRKIIGLGGTGVSGSEASADPAAVTSRAFDAAQFDVDLAAAFTRWVLYRMPGQAGIPWWLGFSEPRLVISWGAWGWVSVDRRRAFLALHRRLRVDVNGRPAVRPRIDLPLPRASFASIIDPGT
jgi:hypothetical protein